MLLTPGDEIGRYRILAALGGGGMGEVYRAHDARLARDVALKVLRPDDKDGGTGDDTTNGAARMIREARAAAALEHANLIAVYDVGELTLPRGQGEVAFIAMELVKGRPLRAHVGDASIPLAERLRWLIDVARGLGAAHAAGIVHRDVKPENVMIRRDGVVKVLDFGVAKKTASLGPALGTTSTEAQIMPTLTARGAVVGTPYYMAPEQMRNETLDGRVDQFAWGVMAYELLTGKPPWGTEGGALQTMSEILSGDPVPPSRVNPQIPPGLEAVVMRTLRKSREQRYETMEALVAALTDDSVGVAPTEPRIVVAGGRVSSASLPDVAGESQTSGAHATVLAGPVGRRGSGRAWVAGLAAALLLAGGGLAVERWHASRPAPSTAPAASAVPARECTTSDACARAAGGKPRVCRDGACVALESEDCRVMAEPSDVGNDETLWIGAMYRKPENPDGVPRIKAMDLARREIARAGGLPPRKGSAKRRPVGVLLCSTERDERAAATHLAEVGVPVVVGYVRDVDTIASVFLPRGMALLSLANDGRLTRIQPAQERPRLVWRATASAASYGSAAAALVSSLAADARAAPRVLILRLRSEINLQRADAFLSTLRVGGKSVADMASAILEIDHDVSSPQMTDADREKMARFAPTVVVALDATTDWLQALEAMRLSPRPLYVVMGGPWIDAIPSVVGGDERARPRFYVIDTPATTDQNVKFAMRFNDAFAPSLTVTAGSAPSVPYDPIYVAALAAVASSDRPLTGASIAEGIAALVPPGPRVEVGPAQLFEAFDRVQSGQHIDLDGAGSPLDFDVATGESDVGLSVYCLQRSRTGLDWAESGALYDPAAGALRGLRRCR